MPRDASAAPADPAPDDSAQGDVDVWKDAALNAWADAADRAVHTGADPLVERVAALERELSELRSSLSWRLTTPVRAVGGARVVAAVRRAVRRRR